MGQTGSSGCCDSDVKAVMNYGEEESQDRQAIPPEDCREGQTLSMRHLPPKKPKADQDACSVVLLELPGPERRDTVIATKWQPFSPPRRAGSTDP
jgi:hypothetical protein